MLAQARKLGADARDAVVGSMRTTLSSYGPAVELLNEKQLAQLDNLESRLKLLVREGKIDAATADRMRAEVAGSLGSPERFGQVAEKDLAELGEKMKAGAKDPVRRPVAEAPGSGEKIPAETRGHYDLSSVAASEQPAVKRSIRLLEELGAGERGRNPGGAACLNRSRPSLLLLALPIPAWAGPGACSTDMGLLRRYMENPEALTQPERNRMAGLLSNLGVRPNIVQQARLGRPFSQTDALNLISASEGKAGADLRPGVRGNPGHAALHIAPDGMTEQGYLQTLHETGQETHHGASGRGHRADGPLQGPQPASAGPPGAGQQRRGPA